MLIREAIRGDVDTIADLEKSAASPWSNSIISGEMNLTNSTCRVLVNTLKDVIIGWCCARLLPPEAELLKIIIHRDYRRTELGTYLIRDLIEQCKKVKCQTLFLEVREKNVSARKFYQKIGFSAHGIRQSYYRDPLDNCLILKKTLLAQTIDQPRRTSYNEDD